VLHLEQAIRMEPHIARFHCDLGVVHFDTGDVDRALAEFDRALQLDPRLADARHNRGATLRRMDRLAEAIVEFRRAVDLNPDVPGFQSSLGCALADAGRPGEALEHLRRAIASEPKVALHHFRLGLAQVRMGSFDAAILDFQEAARLDEGMPENWYNLALALLQRNRPKEALASALKCREVASRSPGLVVDTTSLIRDCEARVREESLLEQAMNGAAPPEDPIALAALARVAFNRGLWSASATCYQHAFAADLSLARDVTKTGHGLLAARAAIRASVGEEGDRLSVAERARLRDMAYHVLRAQLGAWRSLKEEKRVSRNRLEHALEEWESSVDFAPIRDPEHLGRLSDEERRIWSELWADIAARLGDDGGPRGEDR
jgi:tetratricopeptide (TPR) repeat protein